jgi:hypothetical protein
MPCGSTTRAGILPHVRKQPSALGFPDVPQSMCHLFCHATLPDAMRRALHNALKTYPCTSLCRAHPARQRLARTTAAPKLSFFICSECMSARARLLGLSLHASLLVALRILREATLTVQSQECCRTKNALLHTLAPPHVRVSTTSKHKCYTGVLCSCSAEVHSLVRIKISCGPSRTCKRAHCRVRPCTNKPNARF